MTIPIEFNRKYVPALCAGILAAFYFLVSFGDGRDFLLVNVSSLHIYLSDAISFVLYFMVFLVLIVRAKYTDLELTLIAIFALMIFQVIRGMGQYGTSAAVDFRHDELPIAATFFLAVLGRQFSRHELARVFQYLAVIAFIVYFLRIIGLCPVLEELTNGEGDNAFRRFRLISSDEAQWIAYYGTIILSFAVSRDRDVNAKHYYALSAFMFVFAFLLMHRSVWFQEIATFVLFPLVLRHFSLVDQRTVRRAWAGVICLFVFAVILTLTNSTLNDAARTMDSSNGTMMWRVLGWQYLLNELTPSNVLLGLGYGSGLGRWIGASYVQADAHNIFVNTLMRLGLIGVFLFVYLYGRCIQLLCRVASHAQSREDRNFAALLIILIVADVTYEMAYGFGWGIALFLGFAIGFLRNKCANYVDVSQIIFGVPTTLSRRFSGGGPGAKFD